MLWRILGPRGHMLGCQRVKGAPICPHRLKASYSLIHGEKQIREACSCHVQVFFQSLKQDTSSKGWRSRPQQRFIHALHSAPVEMHVMRWDGSMSGKSTHKVRGKTSNGTFIVQRCSERLSPGLVYPTLIIAPEIYRLFWWSTPRR